MVPSQYLNLVVFCYFSLAYAPTSRFLGHMMPLVAAPSVTTSCSVEIASVYPCYPYIALPADTRSPSEMCCDIFRESYDIGSARCICLLLSPEIAGVPIDQERVFLLDELCGTSRSLRSICAGPLPPTLDLRGGTPFTTATDDDGVPDEPAVHHGHIDEVADPSTDGPADVHVDMHILSVYMRFVIAVLGLIVVILLFILIRESRRVDSADTHGKVC
ncbi:hypothetical protein Acr_20g0000810 [Actinidia rufa]|uniref:Bifunctional inhibitor/plant lipid transfer protein/seed storage helical domain-containing protein n=1 Tax=Actinidia rufa TaxID=165716 RepID=A0A7J0GBV8_9ERIC|nr:hypothetical protein Acr_20g0000810 [Actinidia rufa]